MRKGKHVIGQNVLSYADGSRIDSVKDLLISAANDSVVALLVDEGGLLSSSRVVPIENVHKFGRDAVVIQSADSVVKASADPDVNATLHRKDSLLGKKVLTNEGQAYGTISDMYFDDETGRISGFEVSGGFLGDIARGTSFLPVADIERMGPDVIFIRPDTGQALEGQVGGVHGGVQGAISSAQEGLSKAQQSAQSAIAQNEPEKGLIGRRAGADVTDENGRVVVANGERIRAEHVEWAKQTNNVRALTSAATAGTMADARARAGMGLQTAGDSLGSMWDRFVARMGEMRDEQGKQIDAAQTANRVAQVQDAIGRPVMKVILDRSDNVILDFGDIVTHQAIQQAFDNGMLDTLLASVHRATVSFPNEHLKARLDASARVDKASGGALVLDELQRKVEQTERERADQQEQARLEAERARQQRDTEREQRAEEREEAERQRLAELEAVKAAGSASASSSGVEASSARQPQPVPMDVQGKDETRPVGSR